MISSNQMKKALDEAMARRQLASKASRAITQGSADTPPPTYEESQQHVLATTGAEYGDLPPPPPYSTVDPSSTSTSAMAREEETIELTFQMQAEKAHTTTIGINIPRGSLSQVTSTSSSTADTSIAYQVNCPVTKIADKLRGVNNISDISGIIDETVSHLMVDAFFTLHPDLNQEYKALLKKEMSIHQTLIKELVNNEQVLSARQELIILQTATAAQINVKSFQSSLNTTAQNENPPDCSSLHMLPYEGVATSIENIALLKCLLPENFYLYLNTDHLRALPDSPLCPNAKTHFPANPTALIDRSDAILTGDHKKLWAQTGYSEYLKNIRYLSFVRGLPIEISLWATAINANYAQAPNDEMTSIWETFQQFQQRNPVARATLAKNLMMSLLINHPTKIAELLPHILSSMTINEVNAYFAQDQDNPLNRQVRSCSKLVNDLQQIKYSYTTIQTPACSAIYAPEQQSTLEKATTLAEHAITNSISLQEILGITSIIRTATLLNPHKNPWMDGAYRSDIHSSTRQGLMKKAKERIVVLAQAKVTDMIRDVYMIARNQTEILATIQQLKDLRDSPVAKEFRNTSSFYTPTQTTTVKKIAELIDTLEQAYKEKLSSDYVTEKDGRPSTWSSWFGGK